MSGRTLEVSITAPGIQFYTGNFLDGTFFGKGQPQPIARATPSAWSRACFPIPPTIRTFPTARLNPGQNYLNTIVYKVLDAK